MHLAKLVDERVREALIQFEGFILKHVLGKIYSTVNYTVSGNILYITLTNSVTSL